MYNEGKSSIKYTKDSFLNKDATVSRDISVAFIASVASKDTTVIDTTAATGIRGIRYYLETHSKKITFLEINKKVFSSLNKNIKNNKVKAHAFNRSIQDFANTTAQKFDIIDLDPFGGVTPYIYDLMKIAKGDTYLLITATDAAVLCGADYKACLKQYDARPMHNELCKEVGLRILIGYIARIAAQFNFGLEVQISFSYMHYMRVFLKLHHGSTYAFESIKNLGYAYYCQDCGYRDVVSSIFPKFQICPNCKKGKLEISGKLWTKSICNKKIVSSLLQIMDNNYYDKKSIKFLEELKKELDIPLYYSIPMLTRKMKMGSVSNLKVMRLLSDEGFDVSPTHLEKSTIKTNASLEDIQRIIKKV